MGNEAHFIPVDDIEETFRNRHSNERPDCYETTIDREAIRDELIARLTQSLSLLIGEYFNGTVDDR